jgi:dTDP-4-dehydrorhamnose reductase
MTIVVVGAAGLLGAGTVVEWTTAGHTVHGLTRADLDVTDHHRVLAVIEALAPDVVINCTAYNKVDDAEGEPATALGINTWAVRSLAEAAERAGAVFVHYSTDFVFDGLTDRPYVEDDAPNPQSAYGMSKLMGEWFAQTTSRAPRSSGAPQTARRLYGAPPTYVLRVESLFCGTAARSSLDSMLRKMRAGEPVTAFADRTVSPSYVADVTRATRALVEQGAPGGTYHCVNDGTATWLDVAHYLRELAGLPDAEIRGVPSAAINLRAKRPRFVALSNAKLTSLAIAMPTWQDAVARHMNSER